MSKYKSVTEMVNDLSGPKYKKAWAKRDQKIPVIAVSEISRMLVNLRKWYLKLPNMNSYTKAQFLVVISDVRKKLELRRRSREGVNIVPKNIRYNRKIRSKSE